MSHIRSLLAATALATALATTAVPAVAFTQSEKDEMGEVIRAYLLENPEVIPEAMAVLAERQKQAALAQVGPIVERMADVAVMGNPDGDVTIVEFFDYNCGWCKRSVAPVMDAVNADGNVRVVLMEYPVLRESSVTAARAALAAAMQDKYATFHLALMDTKGALSDEKVFEVAAEVGLDVSQLKRDMDGPIILQQLQAARTAAQALDVSGTPAFLIGDTFKSGAFQSASDVTAAINAARAAEKG